MKYGSLDMLFIQMVLRLEPTLTAGDAGKMLRVWRAR